MIKIISEKDENGMKWFETDFGQIFISKYGIQVCAKNASHKCWRGLGKRFNNLNDAMGWYKSPKMRALVEYAIERTAK